MKEYTLTISGDVTVTVKAENEDDAIDKAISETVASELGNWEVESIEEV